MTIENLLGLTDYQLRLICSRATHQHFKGGLYRSLGYGYDSTTGEILLIEGEPQVTYEHLHPYHTRIWIRSEKEFYGLVEKEKLHPSWPLLAGKLMGPRFRRIT